MKLRIKGNSLRLRLGQSEVRRLAIDGTLEESAVFGPFKEQRFGYALCVSPAEAGVSATFTGRRIIVQIPPNVVQEWITTDQVGINATQRTGDNDELLILIEKDFECIDAPLRESQEDAFPNPQLETACRPAGGVERST